MTMLTDYGKTVKHRLIDLGMTQKQLQDAITAKTGLYCDTSNLGKILTGQLGSARIIAAINDILGIDKEDSA